MLKNKIINNKNNGYKIEVIQRFKRNGKILEIKKHSQRGLINTT
jgi:hypothetical protein